MGCGAESSAVLECAISQPLVCTSTSKGPRTLATADCSRSEDLLFACLPSCGSGVAAGGSGVNYHCLGGKVGDVRASCTGSCECECTAGPKTGQRFSVASCGLTVVEKLLSENCY